MFGVAPFERCKMRNDIGTGLHMEGSSAFLGGA